LDASSGEAWSEMDISDPTNEIAHGRTLAETARFFAGGQVEVRYKMKESSEIEQLPPGAQWRGVAKLHFDLSHARWPAGGILIRRRLACFFPLFRSGTLPIKLARGSFPNRLCWPAPSARPLQRTVDQNRQQKHRTHDLHDRE